MINLKEFLELNDKMFTVRLPDNLLKKVKRQAKKYKTTSAKYIKAAIIKTLSEDEPQNND